MSIGLIKRARNDDAFCGDAYGHWRVRGKTTLCIIDGLGHGQPAETAAGAAIDHIDGRAFLPLAELFTSCNQALRGTRGAAMGVAVIDERLGNLTFAGVGNTRAMVCGARTARLVSSHGIVGAGYRKLLMEETPLDRGDLVILTTDGIRADLDLAAYPAKLRGNPQALAEMIVHEWRQEPYDDAAVLVFQYFAA